MRIIETLEGRGLRLPLMRDEAELVEKTTSITRQVIEICNWLLILLLFLWEDGRNQFLYNSFQLKGARTGLSARVHNLLSISRMRANAGDNGLVCLPGSTKIDGQSLSNLQEVTKQINTWLCKLLSIVRLIVMVGDAKLVLCFWIRFCSSRLELLLGFGMYWRKT